MTDLRAQLQEGLGSSYTLERKLGRGGMATVFLARDVKHDSRRSREPSPTRPGSPTKQPSRRPLMTGSSVPCWA
jgi:serine/threonine protein kinase